LPIRQNCEKFIAAITQHIPEKSFQKDTIIDVERMYQEDMGGRSPAMSELRWGR
jgi:hypothetical protein